ncbi:phosphatidylinositol 4 [Tropilaelaps mercedesae]|uniref:Phosphatidylinositol 4 n=1 Tax=Tropilaelaps mercedesae TaxID=418985 RepID=A0A1V9XH85_9ACAR|nr:phosphatidylinositol 4 [Tropilaelaps mercedesae]
MTERPQQDFRVRVITWNVAATSPKEDLRELVGVGQPFDKESLPDLYAIGYQEVSVSPMNMVNQALFEQEWITPVRQILAEFDFVKLINYRLQGLVLAIFVRRVHLLHIRDIYPTCVRTGFLGAWGNKGASIVSFRAYGASMSFTNSHLAAHDHDYTRRTEDYAVIASTWCGSSPRDILGHDYVFWFGDLNFRLDERITMNELKYSIQEGSIMNMLQHDQLFRAQRHGEAFTSMSEGKISFRPTFKYLIGTSDYKLNSRRPAWTDRILYQCNSNTDGEPKLAIELLDYRAHENYVQSDHKPVSALFTVRVFKNEPIQDRVYFFNTGDWSASQGFELWFCTPMNMRLHSSDWIGLLRDNFTTLDEYCGYIWVDTRRISTTLLVDEENPDLPIPRHVYRQTFCDQMLILPGSYRLVYFRSKSDVLGVSDPFKVTWSTVHRRTPSSYYRVST